MSLDEGCFQRCLVSDSIILKPHRIGRNVREVIHAKLCEMFEGICSRHGYILPGSIRLHRTSPGSLEGANLNGDVRYDLQYHAMVCNPAIGSVIVARVVNKSRFGFLLHSGASPVRGDAVAPLSAIVETIVSRQATYTDLANADPVDGEGTEMLDLDIIQIGDVVNILVMGKKFLLNNNHISVVGKIVKTGVGAALETNTLTVPTIGDNKEEDLSVIAAAEDLADEREDVADDETEPEDEGTEADGSGDESGNESPVAKKGGGMRGAGAAEEDEDSSGSQGTGTDTGDDDEEEGENDDGEDEDADADADAEDDGMTIASDEDELV